MSFASYPFILFFLPVAIVACVALGRLGTTPALVGVVAASLVFYGWSDPRLLVLLVGTAVANHAAGAWLARLVETSPGRSATAVLVGGVILNLAPLVWFKTVALSPGTAVGGPGLGFAAALPLGISFFTFQQVKYLVDVYRGDPPAPTLLAYVLFVAFFPKLIAGPLVPHADFFAQVCASGLRGRGLDFAEGVTIFTAGLAKKAVLADSLAPHVGAVFSAAAKGEPLAAADAWVGAIGYALQLYFDFSGYSDMAIGIARLFGIRLPVNFDAPYRAASIIDFWKRWHITLSNLFFELVYFPIVMAVPLRAAAIRYAAIVLTMLVCGAWHGLGLTFIAWALLHAAFLVVNHAWRGWRRTSRPTVTVRPWWAALASRALTFGVVTLAWVFFRAADVSAAGRVILGMSTWYRGSPTIAPAAVGWIAMGLLVVWFLPTTQAWLEDARDDSPLSWVRWRPSVLWAVGMGMTAVLGLLFLLSHRSEFIYFAF